MHADTPTLAFLTLPTIEDLIETPTGEPGFLGTWHSHSDQNLTVIEKPVKTQKIDETNMFFSNSQPKELTERFTLRLRATLKPFERDTDFQFGLTVAGRAKLFVDGKLVVDNWTKQKRGDAFFGTGTVEERGVVRLEKGKRHELYIDFSSVRGPAGDDGDNTVTLGGSAIRVGGAEVLEEEKAIGECVELVRDEEVERVVVVVGLNGDWESEGYDRTTLKLPGRTDKLVESVAEAAKGKVVVVTQSVSVFLSFESSTFGAWCLVGR
jgi:beta-glucosidase